MDGLIMTAQLLLSLSILVAVHEWGHLIAAKTFKIRVEKFYIFFDFLFPFAHLLNFSLLKYKKGDTEYGIGWFPLGGYVKIAGMVDESMDKEQLKATPQPWEFRSKPAWQRLIVMLGGIIVNVALGVLIFVGMVYKVGKTYAPNDYVNQHGGIRAQELGRSIGFKTGDKIIKINGKSFVNFQDILNPDIFFQKNPYYTVLRNGREITIDVPPNFLESFNKQDAVYSFVSYRVPSVVGSVLKGTVADRVGLKQDDRIVSIQDRPIQYQDEIQDMLQSNMVDSISFVVQRGAQRLFFKEPFYGKKAIGFYAKGIDRKHFAHIDYGILPSIALGTKKAFNAIFLQIKVLKKIFSGDVSLKKSLSGPIGIAHAFGSKWDWEHFWYMTGLLSMVLAFMNLLPIPALDGGHAVFLVYEMVTGRQLSERLSTIAVKIGMAIMLLLMIAVFYNDIVRFVMK